MTKQIASSKYFAHVDGLRAIAVLIVILFHLDIAPFQGGYIGVDIFFVISGFLITSLLKKELESTGDLDFKTFYVRRVKRLAPALIATALLTFFFSAIFFSPGHLQRTGAALVSSLLSVSNFFFWLEADYFDTSAKLKPFLHTWSLSIEEQFYFFWPLSIFALFKFRLRRYMLPIILLIGLASLWLNYKLADGQSWAISNYLPALKELIEDGKSTLFFLLPFRVFEFVIGASLVWVMGGRMPFRILYDVLLLIGLILIGYSVFYFEDTLIFPYWYALIPCLGAALVIYSGGNAYLSGGLTNKIMVGVGLISYSLYLVHWPIIVFFNFLASELGITQQVIAMALTFIIGSLMWRFVERPFRNPFFFSQNPKWKYVLLATLFTLISSGIHASKTGGWEWRVGEPVVNVVNIEEVENAQTYHRVYYGGQPGYGSYSAQDQNRPIDIMVIGDSHSAHYAYGLNEIFSKKHGANLFVGGFSCMHLPGITRLDKHASCMSRTALVLEKASILQAGSIVILSNSWNSQMSSDIGSYINDSGDATGETLTISGVIKKIILLSESIGEAKLIVIGNVPTAGANLYDVFTRPRPIFFNDFNQESYFFRKRDPRLEETNRALRQAAEETRAFKFIDPFDYFCDSERCKNIDTQRRLIYSDSGHLSRHGSIYLIERIESQLLELINQR